MASQIAIPLPDEHRVPVLQLRAAADKTVLQLVVAHGSGAVHVPLTQVLPPPHAVPLGALVAPQAPVWAEHVLGLQGLLEAGQAVGAWKVPFTQVWTLAPEHRVALFAQVLQVLVVVLQPLPPQLSTWRWPL